MTRSVLMSLLVRQHLALKQAFSRRYPHGWVVWEAGAWNVTDTGEQNIARTRLPTEDLRDCLPQGDVLCFELAPPADGRALSVGRSSENDVVLNDATVSREHLALKFADGRWSVEARSITEARLHGERPLRPGEPVKLKSGDKLSLGDVTLTFYDADGFLERIRGEQHRMLAATAAQSRREALAR